MMKILLIIMTLSLGSYKVYGSFKERFQTGEFSKSSQAPGNYLFKSVPKIISNTQDSDFNNSSHPLLALAGFRYNSDSNLNKWNWLRLHQPSVFHRHYEEAITKILEAELSFQNGDLEFALERYIEVVKITRDKGAARRAVDIAIKLDSFQHNRKISVTDDGERQMTDLEITAMLDSKKQKQLEAARLWYEVDPLNIKAIRYLALSLMKAGNIDGVVEHFRELVETSDSQRAGFVSVEGIFSLLPRNRESRERTMSVMRQFVSGYGEENVEAQFALARVLGGLGQYEEALGILEPLALSHPDNGEIVIFQSRVYKKMGDRQQSFTVLENFLERNPDSDKVRAFYAGSLLEIRNYGLARSEYEKILEGDPENKNALYSLGLLFFYTHRLDQAKQKFEKLLTLELREIMMSSAYYLLASIARIQGHFPDAMDLYGKVLSIDSNWFNSQLSIARLMAKTGDLKSARHYLHALINKVPEKKVSIRVMEANLLEKAGQYEEAMAIHIVTLRESPEDLGLINSHAGLAQKMGQLNVRVVESRLRKILSRDLHNAEVLNSLGYFLITYTQRYREAHGILALALQIEPNASHIIDSMGWALFKLERYEEAREHLEKAISFSFIPSPEIAAHLGEVYWVLGRKDEARKVWSGAIEMKPDNEYLLETMERLDPKG